MIQILAYDVINGTRTHHERYTHKNQDGPEELKAARDRILKTQQKEHPDECEIFLVTREEFTAQEIAEARKSGRWIEEFKPEYDPK